MKINFGKVLAAGLGLAALSIGGPANAGPVSVRELAAEEVRLATIAYRMAAANAHVCKAEQFVTGMVLHDLTRYDRSVRQAVSAAFSVNRGFGVLGVVPGSVAAESGLQIDDEILSIGSTSVADDMPFDRPKSFSRMEQFNSVVQSALREGSTELHIRRGGSMLRIVLRAQRGCGGNVTLTPSSTINAWADGKNIIVTTGMAKLSRSTDEIAFVIAHEMAHNILGHADEGHGRRGIFGASKIKRGEIEADSFAVGLMMNGGYQPNGGISFLQNASRRMWWNVSFAHPGFGRRIKVISAAMSIGNWPQTQYLEAQRVRRGRFT